MPSEGNADSRQDFADGARPLENVSGQNLLGDLRISELLKTAATVWERGLHQPTAFAKEQIDLIKKLGEIASGTSDLKVPPGDRRFTDPTWQTNQFYSGMLQGYLAWSQSLQNYADKLGLSPKETGRARFLLSQISEALAPTNFLLGNPVALKAAIESGGKSLLDGYQNFLTDAAARKPVPSQVDQRPFKVGKNLAVTRGDVVMRTEMFELLQYAPQTDQVRRRPILFVPSIINKYYVFDIAPERSLFEYLVKSGFTVFSMVFRNPGHEHDDWGMESYMDAMDAAISAVREITDIEDPHVMAACGAGPLMTSLAGYYAARGERRMGSLTLFVAPLDTATVSSAPGIGDFVDPKLNEITNRLGGQSSRISANEFSLLFAMLRPNDLIWNYWVNNYLLGKDPPAFDILYWNADATGMTGRFNSDFQAFVQRNPLTTPGVMTVKGTRIADISQLDFDCYVIAARTDHICPWPSVYRSAQMLGERCQFVLGGSGHIQTIVCPPTSSKAHYFLNPDKSKNADEWLKEAAKVDASWWDHFVAWCGERSGELVSPPASPGNTRYPSLGPAPGTYVFETVS